MKRAVVLAALLVFGLSLAGSIQATPVDTVVLEFTGWDSNKAQTRTIMGRSVITGMYNFEIDTDGDGIYDTDFSGWCVDPWGTLGYDQPWQASWYEPTDLEAYNGHLYRNDRLGSDSTDARILQNYRMIGSLYDTYLPGLSTADDYADFHEALMLAAWYTGDWMQPFVFPSGSGSEESNWDYDPDVHLMIEFARSLEGYNSGSPPFTYTPMDGYHGMQEIINPSVTPGSSVPGDTLNPVPEPNTLLLLGSGLVGFSGLRFLRRKEKAT